MNFKGSHFEKEIYGLRRVGDEQNDPEWPGRGIYMKATFPRYCRLLVHAPLASRRDAPSSWMK